MIIELSGIENDNFLANYSKHEKWRPNIRELILKKCLHCVLNIYSFKKILLPNKWSYFYNWNEIPLFYF